MRIDTIVNLVDGILTNSGYISDVIGFADKIEKVKREFLFISNDRDEIKKAVEKGVYAILYSDDSIEIIDNEIAWINVLNINEALLALLKYRLLNVTLYTTDLLTIQILKSINRDKKLAILDSLKIVDYLNGDYIFITNLDRIKNLSANRVELKKETTLDIINYSLFQTTFLFRNRKYNKILFPLVYLSELQKALNFMERFELKYNLKQVKVDRFVPIFINRFYKKVKFGATDRVIITGVKKDRYFVRELNFIFDNGKYGKVRFFDRDNIEKLEEENFNFAVLIDVDVKLNGKEIETKKII